MLGLQNFGHMTTSAIYSESRDKVVVARNYNVVNFISPYLHFEKTLYDIYIYYIIVVLILYNYTRVLSGWSSLIIIIDLRH